MQPESLKLLRNKRRNKAIPVLKVYSAYPTLKLAFLFDEKKDIALLFEKEIRFRCPFVFAVCSLKSKRIRRLVG